MARFLSALAVKSEVSLSTQNQAFSAFLFLYRQVLNLPLDDLGAAQRAQRTRKTPVVLTKAEARSLLKQLEGLESVMGMLLYGSGLRLLELLRLRVKDVDFAYAQITIRDGEGNKDRVTMLPVEVAAPLQRHLERRKLEHQRDV